MFKVDKRNTRTRCEIYPKLAIKIPERCQDVKQVINFEQVNTGWVSENYVKLDLFMT